MKCYVKNAKSTEASTLIDFIQLFLKKKIENLIVTYLLTRVLNLLKT